MVKMNFLSLLAGTLFLSGLVAGCKQPSNPVIPAGAAVLHLTIPSFVLNSKPSAKSLKISPKDVVPDGNEGAFEYYLVADGQAPVTGVILYNSGSDVGNIYINLPKAGNWLVSGEWFYVYNPNAGSKNPGGVAVKSGSKLVISGLADYPEFVGADVVNVQGTTSFTLNMEDIGYQEYNCYQANLTDATDCDYNLGGAPPLLGSWPDFYSFDSDLRRLRCWAGRGTFRPCST